MPVTTGLLILVACLQAAAGEPGASATSTGTGERPFVLERPQEAWGSASTTVGTNFGFPSGSTGSGLGTVGCGFSIALALRLWRAIHKSGHLDRRQ